MLPRIKTFKEYQEVYKFSIEEPEKFWNEIAEEFYWFRKWDRVLEWEFQTPAIKWFINGKLNITENCLDRFAEKHPDKIAIIWEPNDSAEKGITFTYKELLEEVCRCSNLLKNHGIQKGDRVCIYMPMIPSLAIALLACARIGAIHSVVFAGFSAASLVDRINDLQCKMIICSDGAFRGNKIIPIKDIVDEAVQKCSSVEKVLVRKRTLSQIQWNYDKDIWWDDDADSLSVHCEAEIMDAEDELFILYTSGSTGKPKGVVHTCGGYMVYAAYSFANVFQYAQHDIFWCTADIGWITGHSYLVYGPLLNGATTLMFEGIPTYPDAGRFWQIIDKHKVNIFYTAPTAIRALMRFGDEFITPYDLTSLKTLGSVGEPINEEAWHWYFEKIGKNNCSLVDTWWQTETGGILISPLAHITPLIPCYATLPLPGIQPLIVDSNGNEQKDIETEGLLCMKFPWPGMIRTTYKDHERCRTNYFSQFKNLYFTGDGCKRDKNGNYRIIGRVDDVIIVSGHRIGTAEVENAINEHPSVIESAVVGYPHDIKGQGIYAYVICNNFIDDYQTFTEEIKQVVSKMIGAIAKPDKIQIVSGLPKTRSGKIMRRILRKIAEGDVDNLGDITTLLDPNVVEEIKNARLPDGQGKL
ncbi:MAG: acetate--CoA ligase [Chitinophagales bacterium]|nr:acetate--CoA ligase [Chitinophagales bacterium]